MSALRLCLTLSVGVLNWMITSSPTPPPKRDEEMTASKQETSFIKIAVRAYRIAHSILIMDVIFESCVILAARYPTLIPSFVTSLLIPEGGNDLATRISVTTYALIAWIIAASGCFLRYYSIKMLGRFFTYRLALRNDHALISSGPYSYVRHPGYTGAIIAAIGTGMFLLGPGSYAYECFALRTIPGTICAAIWVGWKAFAAVNLVRRTAYEDEFLRGQFGKQWDDWARKVGYRLFPGIFWTLSIEGCGETMLKLRFVSTPIKKSRDNKRKLPTVRQL